MNKERLAKYAEVAKESDGMVYFLMFELCLTVEIRIEEVYVQTPCGKHWTEFTGMDAKAALRKCVSFVASMVAEDKP